MECNDSDHSTEGDLQAFSRVSVNKIEGKMYSKVVARLTS